MTTFIPIQSVEPKSNLVFNTFYHKFMWICVSYGYKIFLFPYRFEYKNPANGNTNPIVRLHTNPWQKVICGIVHTSCVLKFFSKFASSLTKNLNRNPVDYLMILLRVMTLTYYCNVILFIWTKQNAILKFMNFVHANFHRTCWRHSGIMQKLGKQSIIIFIYIIFGVYFMGTIISLILMDYSITECPPVFLHFILKNDYPDAIGFANFVMLLCELSWPKMLLGFLEVFFQICMEFMGFFGDLIMIMCALSVWLPSKHFATKIKMEVDLKEKSSLDVESNASVRMSTPEILRMYEDLKKMSGLLNDAVGIVVFMFVIEALLYNSLQITDRRDTIWAIIVWGYTFFCCSTALFLSADAAKQVGSVREWFNEPENRKGVNSSDLQLILQEVTMLHPIGLSGNGYFNLDFSFLTSAISTILTFFILCIQFQQ